MALDSLPPGNSPSRTVRVRANERVPRTAEQYHVIAIQMHGTFDIGVKGSPDDGGSIDDFPHSVHEILPDMVADIFDLDHIRDETTDEEWTALGTLTLSRHSGDTVNVRFEPDPSHLHSSFKHS